MSGSPARWIIAERDRLRLFFENATDAFIVIDQDRRIVEMNPAAVRLTGYQVSQGVQCGTLFQCHTTLGEPLAADDLCYGMHALEAQKPVSYAEMNIRHQDGYLIPVSASYSLLPDGEGGNLLLLVFRDLREKQKLEEALRENAEVVATLMERERLARDFHDGLAQTLAFLKMRLTVLAKRLPESQDELEQIRSVLETAYQDVRQALFDLRAPVGPSWDAALARYLTEFEESTGIRSSLDIDAAAPHVPPKVGVQLLRIIQEALANVRKHSGAECVEVQVGGSARRLTVMVADDGRGFDYDPTREYEGHYGLRTMRERARAIGGSMLLDTLPGRGTRVILDVPVPKQSEEPSLDKAGGVEAGAH
ncbi:MAG: histidine kinase [Bacillota bacterium]